MPSVLLLLLTGGFVLFSRKLQWNSPVRQNSHFILFICGESNEANKTISYLGLVAQGSISPWVGGAKAGRFCGFLKFVKSSIEWVIHSRFKSSPSVRSRHVHPESVWVSSGCSCFLTQSKTMEVRWISDSYRQKVSMAEVDEVTCKSRIASCISNELCWCEEKSGCRHYRWKK